MKICKFVCYSLILPRFKSSLHYKYVLTVKFNMVLFLVTNAYIFHMNSLRVRVTISASTAQHRESSSRSRNPLRRRFVGRTRFRDSVRRRINSTIIPRASPKCGAGFVDHADRRYKIQLRHRESSKSPRSRRRVFATRRKSARSLSPPSQFLGVA